MSQEAYEGKDDLAEILEKSMREVLSLDARAGRIGRETYEGRVDFTKIFAQRTREILSLEANRERVAQLTYDNYIQFYGCSQSMWHAFQKVLGFKDDFWFRAVGGLQSGGSCGLQCGALTTSFMMIAARVGRDDIEEGPEALLPAFEPSHRLFYWFKATYKSTVCSEITGVNFLDVNEMLAYYDGPKGMETVEKCARLTAGTAYKVAEILSQL